MLPNSDIDINDFIGITTLQVFSPEVFTTIFSNKKYFITHINNSKPFYHVPHLKINYEDHFALKFEGIYNNPEILNLVFTLFPVVGFYFNGGRFTVQSSGVIAYAQKDFHISNPDYFERYFSLPFTLYLRSLFEETLDGNFIVDGKLESK